MKCFSSKKDIQATRKERDHGGVGFIEFRRLLHDYHFESSIDFVDFTLIPPGSSIGAHEHNANEEIYFIVSGTPLIKVDDEICRLEKGGISVVHSRQRHELVNDTDMDVEIFVIQVRNPASTI